MWIEKPMKRDLQASLNNNKLQMSFSPPNQPDQCCRKWVGKVGICPLKYLGIGQPFFDYTGIASQ